MEKNKKKISKIQKKLGIILGISVIFLFGISAYALHWEEIAAVDWNAQTEAVKEKTVGWWEQIRGKWNTDDAEEKEALTYGWNIAYMSHQFPALMKVATSQDAWISVPLISQEEVGYQTGCELVSAAMLLNYYGIDVTPEDVYSVIQKSSAEDTDTVYGPDPNVCFIGDPTTTYAFGCYALPLIDAMNQLLDEEWQAVNVSDSDLEDLEKNYLNQGIPIIIWATIHMSEPQKGDSWLLSDGTKFQWIAGEHCLVLVGADEEYYYFNDPNHAGEVVGYERAVVRERYEQLGKQAVIISR